MMEMPGRKRSYLLVDFVINYHTALKNSAISFSTPDLSLPAVKRILFSLSCYYKERIMWHDCVYMQRGKENPTTVSRCSCQSIMLPD